MSKFMQWWLRTQKHTAIKFKSILICENNPLSTENKKKQTNQATWDDLTREISKILMKNQSRLYSSYTQLRPTTTVTINIITSNQKNVWMSFIHKGLACCKLNKAVIKTHFTSRSHDYIFKDMSKLKCMQSQLRTHTKNNNLLNVF